MKNDINNLTPFNVTQVIVVNQAEMGGYFLSSVDQVLTK